MATGSYTHGSTQNLMNGVTWSLGTATFAMISSNGLATSLAAGTTTIQAASGSIGGSTTLTVTAPVLPAITYLTSATLPRLARIRASASRSSRQSAAHIDASVLFANFKRRGSHVRL